MATLIDALIVSLSLDSSGFQKGQADSETATKKMREDSARTAKEFDARGKQMAQALGSVRDQVIGLFAAFTAGRSLKEFVSDLTTSNAALGRMARNLGLSSDQLAAWQGVSERAGGSAASITESFLALSKTFQNFKITGDLSGVRWLSEISIEGGKALDMSKNLGETFLDLADDFSNIARIGGRQRANYLGQQAGINQDTINLLIQGRAALQAYLAEQEKIGHPTERDTDAAAALQNSWITLRQSATNVGQTILTDLTPALIEITDRMARWVKENKAWIESGIEDAIRDFSVWLKSIDWKAVQAGIDSFIERVKRVVDSIGDWARITEILFGIWVGSRALAVLSSAAQIVTAMTAVATAEAAVTAGGGLGGMLLLIGRVAAAATALHFILKGIDPKDDIGTWIDKHIPGASFLDNLAGKIGIGRTYEEQEKARRSSEGKDDFSGAQSEKATPSGTGRSAGKTKAYADLQSDLDSFVAAGWTPSQALGIVASIQAESGGSASAIGDNGQAYGLAQWHPDRQAAFTQWAGHDIRESTRDEQLEFVNYELRYGAERAAGRRLAATTTAGEAGAVVSRDYERPGATAEAADIAARDRSELAESWSSRLGLDPGLQLALSPGAAYATTNAYDNSSTRNSQSEVNIGNINVTTTATDPESVGRRIAYSLSSSLAFQADRG